MFRSLLVSMRQLLMLENIDLCDGNITFLVYSKTLHSQTCFTYLLQIQSVFVLFLEPARCSIIKVSELYLIFCCWHAAIQLVFLQPFIPLKGSFCCFVILWSVSMAFLNFKVSCEDRSPTITPPSGIMLKLFLILDGEHLFRLTFIHWK